MLFETPRANEVLSASCWLRLKEHKDPTSLAHSYLQDSLFTSLPRNPPCLFWNQELFSNKELWKLRTSDSEDPVSSNESVLDLIKYQTMSNPKGMGKQCFCQCHHCPCFLVCSVWTKKLLWSLAPANIKLWHGNRWKLTNIIIIFKCNQPAASILFSNPNQKEQHTPHKKHTHNIPHIHIQ